MELLRYLFGGRINYRLERQAARDCHGEPTSWDFDSYSAMKRSVEHSLDHFACPACGNHKAKGEGVTVQVAKVHLYRRTEYKGWFGGTKYKDRFYKTVWRIDAIGLRTAPGRALLNAFALFDPPPGELRCQSRGCDWSQNGGRDGTVSLGQVLGIRS